MFYPEEKSAFEIHDSCIDILTKKVQTETENVNVCFYCEKREEEKERKLQRGPRARQPSFSNIQKYTHRFLRNIWREREILSLLCSFCRFDSREWKIIIYWNHFMIYWLLNTMELRNGLFSRRRNGKKGVST